MQNILILASGNIAKNFIEWVSKKRVAENQYYVTCHKTDTAPEKLGKNVTIIDSDPTSFSKLNHIFSTTIFSDVFIVLEEKEDAIYTLKNIALIKPSARILLLNQWDDENIGKEYNNLTIIYTLELMATHLYDHLPNVPLIAQNVGLGRGEIMEIHVPFGSSYAYRHIGSILQRKWKIVAVYRDDQQILPTTATMIRPNDTLLVIGKPLVLDGIYKTINKRIGLFPEPFGKDLYLILDLRFDTDNVFIYLKESLYLLEKLENKSLFVRILYPNDFKLIDELKSYESDKVNISVSYEVEAVQNTIEYDINEQDIGLVLNSIKTFEADHLKETLYHLKRLVYLFGDKHLYNIKKAVVLMSDDEKMESISTTAFDVSESLGLDLMLGNFDPEGDFESKKMIIEHYETLTQIFNMKIDIEQKVANPIRELSNMKEILQIAPFEQHLNTDNFMKLISTKIQDFILTTNRHPKLLVPFSLLETKEESKNYPDRRNTDI